MSFIIVYYNYNYAISSHEMLNSCLKNELYIKLVDSKYTRIVLRKTMTLQRNGRINFQAQALAVNPHLDFISS